CAMFGYTLEAMRGLSFTDLTHPEDTRRTLDALQRMREGKAASYNLEKRYLRKDGSTFWSNTTVTLLRDAAGRGDWFFGVLQPVEDRRQNDEMKSRLAAVVNSSDDAIITKTLD